LLLPQVIRFRQPLLQFLLNRQSHFQGQRRYHLHQHRTDGCVDAASRDVLTDPLGVFNTRPLADVGRTQPALTGMVADRHPLPAATTHDQPL
jgi:hypothetical protein